MQDVTTVANSWPIWICAVISVGIVIGQALSYVKLGVSKCELVGLTKKDCTKAFRSGMISAIGPSIASVLVVLSMLAVIGSPVSWIRLSMIGSAATELSAATIGAEACGVSLGSAEYGLPEMATAWFTMAINGCGWLLVVFLFTHRMEKVRAKIGGGDTVWLSLITATACVGLMSDLVGGSLIKFSPKTVAAIVGAVSMFALSKLAKKAKWLKEYSLGFAIVLGLIVGYFVM